MRFNHSQRLYRFLLLLWLFSGCSTIPHHPADARDGLNPPDSPPGLQQLTADGRILLRSFLDKGQLPDLRRPTFSNYQSEVKEFYESFSGSIPWIQQGKPTRQAGALIRALQNAEFKGLSPEDYDSSRWDARLARIEKSRTASEYDLIKFDLALTVCAMRYVSDLHIGRLSPHLFHYDLDIDHKSFDLSEFLTQKLVSSQDIVAALAEAEPPFPVYRRTEVALRTYLDLASRDDGQLLPAASRTVRPGDSYAGAPRLARLLTLLGDLPKKYEVTGDVYQESLVDAVKRFQQRHAVEPNGLIDTATIKELNVPLNHRVTQLQLTMERIRWLPHEFLRPPIVVNIPEFRLHADNEKYQWVLSMKVVVGRAYRHQTPVFASQIRSVIFRPYWYVPSSIVRAELIPHLAKNPFYLYENSYEIVDKNGTVANEGAVNESIEEQLRSGDLRVRQRPGPKNTLGLVKFDIPSRYDVYMHGTPSTELFARSRRDFSHGCIRVEDPVALAEWVLRDEPGWDEEKIRSATNGDRTVQLNLVRPIPVLILYGTAVVMEDGEVHFFDDIYGRDAALESALKSIPRKFTDNLIEDPARALFVPRLGE
jgi:murein L,D-transpeptidase YcbB/YkuD